MLCTVVVIQSQPEIYSLDNNVKISIRGKKAYFKNKQNLHKEENKIF